jgi:CheY-like chemotaxis protein
MIGEHADVLIVEDNDGMREYATAILAELGYRVLDATDAVAALEILDTSPQVDLLFTDVVLPGGVAVMQTAHLPIFMCFRRI